MTRSVNLASGGMFLQFDCDLEKSTWGFGPDDPTILREASDLCPICDEAGRLGRIPLAFSLRMPSVLVGNKLPVLGKSFPFRERLRISRSGLGDLVVLPTDAMRLV
jgi:hypothetical protein